MSKQRTRAATFAALILAMGTVAFARPQAPARRLSASLEPKTLLADVPEVAECNGILTAELIEEVKGLARDPADVFEEWRRANRSMVEASPLVECRSKLWQALQHKSGLSSHAVVPQGT